MSDAQSRANRATSGLGTYVRDGQTLNVEFEPGQGDVVINLVVCRSLASQNKR